MSDYYARPPKLRPPKKQIKLTPNKQRKTHPMLFFGNFFGFKKPEQHDFEHIQRVFCEKKLP